MHGLVHANERVCSVCRRNRQLTVCVLKVEGSSTPGHLIVTATPLEQGSDKISVMQDDLVGGTDGRVQKIERKVVNRPAFVRLQNIETRADDGSAWHVRDQKGAI